VPRVLMVVAALAGLIFLLGCGGGSTILQPPISISLLPSTTVVSLGQSVSVTAAVYDQSNRGAIWTLTPIDFGTLSDQTATSVTYTAPASFIKATTVTITATSITNPNVTSSVQISASPTLVSLSSMADVTLTEGGQLFITPTLTNDINSQGVTWTLSPASGAGSLIDPEPFVVEFAAPGTVSVPTTVTRTATAVASSSASASVDITVFPADAGPNVTVLRVDGGAVPGQTHANGAFTSVTVCKAGSITACQKVDGILVDTGSYGLRILQSELPLVSLPKLVDGNGNVLENCASAIDGSYLWGPVSTADVYVGGEIAPWTLVQVISSSNAPVPDGCSNGGMTNANTPQLLGANGILGVGPEPTDCSLAGINYCDGSNQPVPPNVYYSCPTQGCATTDPSIIVPINQQVTNVITLFSTDNNGVILDLPPVSAPAASLTGKMIFGIGTSSNNDLGSATVFTTDSTDHFTTIFAGQTLTSSFIDSGSNALFFPDSLPACTASTPFYCPLSLTNLSAINQGATEGQSTVNFSVDNADNLFSTYVGDAVFSTLAGAEGTSEPCSSGSGSCTFDWGLPFFYGRRVYTAIAGKNAPAGAPAAPWWAY
jgi:hypothetical protein